MCLVLSFDQVDASTSEFTKPSLPRPGIKGAATQTRAWWSQWAFHGPASSGLQPHCCTHLSAMPFISFTLRKLRFIAERSSARNIRATSALLPLPVRAREVGESEHNCRSAVPRGSRLRLKNKTELQYAKHENLKTIFHSQFIPDHTIF